MLDQIQGTAVIIIILLFFCEYLDCGYLMEVFFGIKDTKFVFRACLLLSFSVWVITSLIKVWA